MKGHKSQCDVSGVKSAISALGTADFRRCVPKKGVHSHMPCRLQVGIGRPASRSPMEVVASRFVSLLFLEVTGYVMSSGLADQKIIRSFSFSHPTDTLDSHTKAYCDILDELL